MNFWIALVLKKYRKRTSNEKPTINEFEWCLEKVILTHESLNESSTEIGVVRTLWMQVRPCNPCKSPFLYLTQKHPIFNSTHRRGRNEIWLFRKKNKNEPFSLEVVFWYLFVINIIPKMVWVLRLTTIPTGKRRVEAASGQV